MLFNIGDKVRVNLSTLSNLTLVMTFENIAGEIVDIIRPGAEADYVAKFPALGNKTYLFTADQLMAENAI